MKIFYQVAGAIIRNGGATSIQQECSELVKKNGKVPCSKGVVVKPGSTPHGAIWGTLWGTFTKIQTIIFLKRLLEGNSANGRTDRVWEIW